MTDNFRPEVALHKEDRRLIKRSGTYVGDIKVAEMPLAAFVRSDVAHGVVGNIDTADAHPISRRRAPRSVTIRLSPPVSATRDPRRLKTPA